MDVYQAIKREKSIRRFAAAPVPDEVARRIVDAARRCGSAKNSQAWEFVLIRDRAQLKAFSETSSTCAHVAGADFAVVIVVPADASLAVFDAGRAFQNMILAANAESLGSCIATPNPLAANQVLGVPEGKLAIQALSFGYPAPGNNRTLDGSPLSTRPIPLGRKPLDELLHYDRYGRRAP